MNSIVCLETIAAFVFGFCFICESTLESTLTKGPNGTSAVSGGTVKLECFTGDKNYPPAWSHQKVGSDKKEDISLVFRQDGLIVPKLVAGYAERHSIVGDRSTGEYSLRITDAKPEDAGTYTCTARGGLAEKRSAELSVFEASPVCTSNITDVVGENDCHKEPDVIELSCNFRVYAKHLRKIRWTVADNSEIVLKSDTPTTDDTGMASSKLIIEGDYCGLDTTLFRCIISSTEEADDSRVTCDTPKINVLKFSNLTESKALVAPAEVECTGWTKLNASGCDWFRRDDDDDDDNGRQKETHVTSKPLLNLYRDDMTPGTYICFANCNIRGETCRVKVLKVSYKPSGSESVQSGNANDVVLVSVVVAIVMIVVIVIILALLFWKRGEIRRETEAQRRDNDVQDQRGISLLKKGPKNFNGDVPDAKLGGPTKSERIRLLEERAEARMRENAARRRGENSPAFSPDVDFAEGVAGVAVSERTPLLEEKDGARMRTNVARQSEDNQAFSPVTDIAEDVAADKKKHE